MKANPMNSLQLLQFCYFCVFWMVLLGRQQGLSTSLWSVFLQNVVVSSFIKKTFIYLSKEH